MKRAILAVLFATLISAPAHGRHETPSPTATPSSPDDPLRPTSGVTEVFATDVDMAGTDIRWDKYTPPSSFTAPYPTAIVVHGGGYKGGVPGNLNTAQDIANAGYLTFAIEYRLAPPATPMRTVGGPGDPQNTDVLNGGSDGRPPQQTDDVGRAIRAARTYKDPTSGATLSTGKVVLVCGSAGASHGAWWWVKGATATGDKPDAVVLLSGAYDLDDADSLLNDAFARNTENYLNVRQTAGVVFHSAAQAASAYWQTPFDNTHCPILLVQSEGEGTATVPGMPIQQYTKMVAKLALTGATYEAILRHSGDPAHPDTEHEFAYWSKGDTGSDTFTTVKAYALDFMHRALNPTPTPSPTPTP